MRHFSKNTLVLLAFLGGCFLTIFFSNNSKAASRKVINQYAEYLDNQQKMDIQININAQEIQMRLIKLEKSHKGYQEEKKVIKQQIKKQQNIRKSICEQLIK